MERYDLVQSITVTSKLTLIDLAGSERAAGSSNKGIRLIEGANINRSLLALGNCINMLSSTSLKKGYIPYRDSKITRILKDSLGGNMITLMIACIAPTRLCLEESLNTIKYASRAMNIHHKITQTFLTSEHMEYKDVIQQ